MGLKYSSGDSAALMGALSANLSTAQTMLDSTVSACDQLVEALGGGQLSGKGYASAKAVFTEAITPGLSDVKGVIDDTRSDLERYTRADGLVSKFGVLDEDKLRKQLVSVEAQRSLTERKIEWNRVVVASSATLPTVASSLELANARLEMVLSGLESDIRELEDKLKALAAFNSQTAGLFCTWLEDVVEFVGGRPALGGYVLGAAMGGINVQRVRNFQGGKGFYRDSAKRVRWRGSGGNSRYVYDRYGSKMSPATRPNHLYGNGKSFNAVTGQRIDTYRQPFKAAGAGFVGSLADTGRDFSGWKGTTKLAKAAKVGGVAGTVLAVGSNAYKYFHDGVQGNDVRDFAIDTTVDVGAAAAAAGIGAAVGSAFLPPLGTVAGAVVGLGINFAMNAELFGGKSLADMAKDGIKNTWDWVASKFW